jgi:two-component system nitrate/nitrite response regulator NarL
LADPRKAPLKIKVLIVDDHPLIREGLAAVLGAETDIAVVGVTGSADGAVEMAAQHQPAVVLMDFRLSGRTGAEAAADIRAANPETAVVFLSADESDEALSTAVHAGAAGYLVKRGPVAEIADAIRRAAAGEMLIPGRVLAELMATDRTRASAAADIRQLAATLTDRERQILELTAQGLENDAIAEQLFIELSTVRWHVSNVLEKLGVHSKLAAVALAAENGLVERRTRSAPRPRKTSG